MAPAEPEAPAKIAGDIPLHRDPIELKLAVGLAKTFGASHRHQRQQPPSTPDQQDHSRHRHPP